MLHFKKIPSEYMTKGSPVVFPEEVDEDNGDHAGTPMLTREERPPLKVSERTFSPVAFYSNKFPSLFSFLVKEWFKNAR